MKVKKLEIPCSGYSIVADWYDGISDKNVLMVLPGYSSSRLRQKSFVSAIVKQTGMSAIAVDYSGHGESPFELRDTRPAQHFLEVIYTFDWIRKTRPTADIGVIGTSYGGFLATQLTKYRKFNKLVLRVPAIYKPNAFYDLWAIRIDNETTYRMEMDIYRKDSDAISKHPLLARASQFNGKTLVVVHGEDEVVPRQTTDAFISTFQADSFTAQHFKHSASDLMNNNKVSLDIQKYELKIANWLSTGTI